MSTPRIPRIIILTLFGFILAGGATLLAFSGKTPGATAAEDCQLFPETGFQVCGRFLTYWRENGGLTQQGYPISNAFNEQNQLPPAGDGQIHMVQYFQRARFEMHPENQPPYDVLLGLLGTEQYKAKYGNQVVEATPQLVVRSRKNVTQVDATHQPKSGNTFLMLDLALTNSTGMNLDLNPANFRVKTSVDYEYYASTASYVLDNSLKAGILKPAETTGGFLVFELPAAETPVSLTLTYGQDKITIPLS